LFRVSTTQPALLHPITNTARPKNPSQGFADPDVREETNADGGSGLKAGQTLDTVGDEEDDKSDDAPTNCHFNNWGPFFDQEEAHLVCIILLGTIVLLSPLCHGSGLLSR